MSFSGNFQCILKEENKEYGSGRSCILSVCLSLSFGGGGWGFEFVGVALLKRPIFINIDSRNLYTSQKWSYFYINHFCVSTNLRPLLLIKKKILRPLHLFSQPQLSFFVVLHLFFLIFNSNLNLVSLLSRL